MNLYHSFHTVFEPELLEELEQKASYSTIPAGTKLISMGQMIRQVPIVLSGSIKISRLDEEGKELLLYYLNPMESCAMTFTCCMEQFPSDIEAVTEEETHILFLPLQVMDQWMMKYPSWKTFVMRTIRERFHELMKTVDQIAFQQLDERLVHYLKEKAKITGSPLLNLSHEHIATEMATTRVVISRLLKKLENQKKLLLYRNQIRLLGDM